MKRFSTKAARSALAAAVTAALALSAMPGVALAAANEQTVKSNWNEIICVVEKNYGGADVGDSYGWKIYTTVTVTDGIVTGVTTTGRGNNMPSMPDMERLYFDRGPEGQEPWIKDWMEENIVDSEIDATKPESVMDVDVISGATSTCYWMKAATKEALEKWNVARNEKAKSFLDEVAALNGATDMSAAVAAARAAYEALDEEAQGYVVAADFAIIDAAEAAIPVFDQISALPAKPTTADAKVVAAARAAYDALPAECKALMSTALAKLTQAEKAVATKAANGLSVKVKAVKLKAKALKKKAQKATAFTVKGANGKVTAKITKVNKKAVAKKFKVAANGKLTVAKKLTKGTYKLTIKVSAAGDAGHKSASKTVNVTVKVK